MQEKFEVQRRMENLRDNASPEKKEHEKAADKRRKEILRENATPEKKFSEKAADKRRNELYRKSMTYAEIEALKLKLINRSHDHIIHFDF